MKAAGSVLRRAGRTAAGAIPAALLAGLGLPALGALVFLAVAVLAVTCWVIASRERTDRVSQLMLARRGQADGPGTGSRRIRKRTATVTGVKTRKYWPGSGGPIAKIKLWVVSPMAWVEDHAERVVAIFVTLCLLAVVTAVLLWSWARVINIAIGLAAVLTIAVVTVSAAGAMLNWLRRRRGRRVPPRTEANAPVLTIQASAAALSPAEATSRDNERRSDKGRSDERS